MRFGCSLSGFLHMTGDEPRGKKGVFLLERERAKVMFFCGSLVVTGDAFIIAERLGLLECLTRAKRRELSWVPFVFNAWYLILHGRPTFLFLPSWVFAFPHFFVYGCGRSAFVMRALQNGEWKLLWCCCSVLLGRSVLSMLSETSGSAAFEVWKSEPARGVKFLWSWENERWFTKCCILSGVRFLSRTLLSLYFLFLGLCSWYHLLKASVELLCLCKCQKSVCFPQGWCMESSFSRAVWNVKLVAFDRGPCLLLAVTMVCCWLLWRLPYCLL